MSDSPVDSPASSPFRSPEAVAQRLALAAARARVERERAAALADDALVAAMREHDDPFAWAEYFRRFRPLLTDYVSRVRSTPGLDALDVQHALVDELLEEEAERLMRPNAGMLGRVGPYLLRAARSRLANLRRTAARRQRLYFDAASDSADGIVEATASDYVRRTGRTWAVHEAPPAGTLGGTPTVVARLAALTRAATTPEEQTILSWLGQRIPHRTIALWLGADYDATTKRCWRLCKRLRAAAVAYAAGLGADERREIERFLRRAGVLPALAPPTLTASTRRARTPTRAPAAGSASSTSAAPTMSAPPGAPSLTELDDHV